MVILTEIDSSSSWPSNIKVPPLMKDKESVDWAELPPDLTCSILMRLGNVDILENVQKVCTSWRRVCKDPLIWRKIDLRDRRTVGYDCDRMCRHAIDLSEGGLVEINIDYFGSDSLLNYIVDRSRNLRCLRLIMNYTIRGTGFVNAVTKLTSLEALEISQYEFSNLDMKAIGHSCPNLRTLKLNRTLLSKDFVCDEAQAIAETMPQLRCLKLFGSKLTNTDFKAILDGCPNLEYIDIRRCFNIKMVRDLEKQCFERNIQVRRYSSRNPGPYDTIYVPEEYDDYSNGNYFSFISDEPEYVVDVESLFSSDDDGYDSDDVQPVFCL